MRSNTIHDHQHFTEWLAEQWKPFRGGRGTTEPAVDFRRQLSKAWQSIRSSGSIPKRFQGWLKDASAKNASIFNSSLAHRTSFRNSTEVVWTIYIARFLRGRQLDPEYPDLTSLIRRSTLWRISDLLYSVVCCSNPLRWSHKWESDVLLV